MLQFVLGLLAMTWSCAMSRRDDLRIYKGQLDTLKEFPFVVSLQRFYQPYNTSGRYLTHACTGSLIADNWILTAAHCFVKAPLEIARYGDFTVPVTESKLHAKVLANYEPTPKKQLRGFQNDIGLLLVEKFPKPHVQLHAVDYKALFGLPAKYAGFGIKYLKVQDPRIFTTFPSKSPGLPTVGEGIIIPCKNIKNFGKIICVASKCSDHLQGTRYGDSGGPLLQGGRLVGVTKGPNTRQLEMMGGGSFTPVSLYLEWITNVMSTHGHKKNEENKILFMMRAITNK